MQVFGTPLIYQKRVHLKSKKMKKLIYGGLFLALVGIGVGCNKDKSSPSSSKITNVDTYGVQSMNGLLRFNNLEHVKLVLKELSTAYDTHEESFLSQYPNIDGDSLVNIEDKIGYNEFLPFEAFENKLGVKSLRSIVFETEEKWLNSDQKEEEQFYRFDFIVEDEVQTILNEYAELIIGDTIYKFYSGGYIAVPNLDFNLLQKLRNSQDIQSVKGVKMYGDFDAMMKSVSCRGHVSTPSVGYSSKDFGNSARIKWRVAIFTPPWANSRYVVARTKAYNKPKKQWKKTRAHITCRVWGAISDYDNTEEGPVANCAKQLVFNSSNGVYSEKYNTKSHYHKVYVTMRTASTWVKGYHNAYIGANRTHNSTLIFN